MDIAHILHTHLIIQNKAENTSLYWLKQLSVTLLAQMLNLNLLRSSYSSLVRCVINGLSESGRQCDYAAVDFVFKDNNLYFTKQYNGFDPETCTDNNVEPRTVVVPDGNSFLFFETPGMISIFFLE